MSGPTPSRFGRLTVLPWATQPQPVAARLPPLARAQDDALDDPTETTPTTPASASEASEVSSASEAMCGELRTSADGRVVALVATYLEGSADSVWRANPIVLRVYRDGALFHALRLQDIATRADLYPSLGHVRWTRAVGVPSGTTRHGAFVIETRRGHAFTVSLASSSGAASGLSPIASP